jgi:hypothetical protein
VGHLLLVLIWQAITVIRLHFLHLLLLLLLQQAAALVTQLQLVQAVVVAVGVAVTMLRRVLYLRVVLERLGKVTLEDQAMLPLQTVVAGAVVAQVRLGLMALGQAAVSAVLVGQDWPHLLLGHLSIMQVVVAVLGKIPQSGRQVAQVVEAQVPRVLLYQPLLELLTRAAVAVQEETILGRALRVVPVLSFFLFQRGYTQAQPQVRQRSQRPVVIQF